MAHRGWPYVALALAALSFARPGAAQLTEERRIEIAEQLRAGTVVVQVGKSQGSGFIVGQERWIVTNAHVVRGYQYFPVHLTFGDGTKADGHVVAVDPRYDLALVQPERVGKTSPLKLGDPKSVRVGQTVLAFGNPYGLEGTLTQGIVSARRDLGADDLVVKGLIQTDAEINPGNSGGPLVNSRGEVIGVNTAILSQSGGSQGIGFAVPTNYVDSLIAFAREQRKLAAERKSPGKATSPTSAWLGIYGKDFRSNGVVGVLVEQVVRGGPADRAGIVGRSETPPSYVREMGIPWTGHIITALDGEPVDSMKQLIQMLHKRKPGDRATLSLTVGPGAMNGQAVVRLSKNPQAETKR